MMGPYADEMDVESVNLSDQLWKPVELRFAPAPIVFRTPMANQPASPAPAIFSAEPELKDRISQRRASKETGAGTG